MENAFNPGWAGAIVTIVITLIAFIRWGIQLEKENSRNREKCERAEKDLKEAQDRLNGHILNAAVHFNYEVSKQVDERNKQRFGHIETVIEKQTEKIDRIVDKLSEIERAISGSKLT